MEKWNRINPGALDSSLWGFRWKTSGLLLNTHNLSHIAALNWSLTPNLRNYITFNTKTNHPIHRHTESPLGCVCVVMHLWLFTAECNSHDFVATVTYEMPLQFRLAFEVMVETREIWPWPMKQKITNTKQELIILRSERPAGFLCHYYANLLS